MPDSARQCSGELGAGPSGSGSDGGYPGYPGYGPGSERWTAPGYGEEHDPLHLLAPGSARGGRRGLVMVGVMTADKYLPTRAAAVWDTWGRELPGAIAFFSASYSRPPTNRPDLPLVALKGKLGSLCTYTEIDPKGANSSGH